MGVISVIASVAAVALLIWFTVVWVKQGFTKSIMFLILSLILLFIAWLLKTEDTEMASRLIIGVPSVLMTIGGIFLLFGGENAKERTNSLKVVAVSLLLFLFLGLFGMSFESGINSGSERECSWCEKRPALKGSYCKQCYDKLFK